MMLSASNLVRRSGPARPRLVFQPAIPDQACGQFALNFRASVSCSIIAHRRSARRCSDDGISAACFGVHCFAAHAIVNSPLHCWVLDGEWSWLWKSLYARTNGPSTHAIDACAIH